MLYSLKLLSWLLHSRVGIKKICPLILVKNINLKKTAENIFFTFRIVPVYILVCVWFRQKRNRKKETGHGMGRGQGKNCPLTSFS